MHPKSLNSSRILVVDDSPNNIHLIVNILRRITKNIDYSLNGSDALKKIKESSYDLILLDVMMPELNGFQVCEEIKKEPSYSNIPVIFLTAKVDKESLVLGFDSGAIDYITKPFNDAELIARVKTQLELKRSHEEIIRSRDELQIREEKLRAIFENAIVGICLSNSQDKFVYANSTWLKLFGYRPDEMYDMDFSKIVHPDYYKEADDNIQLIKTNNIKQFRLLCKFIGKSQNEFWADLSVSPIYNNNGNFDSIIYIIVDVNSRVRAEDLAKQNEQKLREANAAKDKFFSIIAHDLKNPLQIILLANHLLKISYNKMDLHKLEENIDNINNAVNGLSNLLDNLLQWSYSQSGKIEYRPGPVDLNLLAKENIDLYQESAKNKYLTIESNIKDGTFIFADKNMISTVIRNLLSNAIKFSYEGGIINISMLADEDNIEVSLTDNGVGISDVDMEKLFRIDVHHSTSGTADEEGTGLGLIICKEFIEKNGGNIWVTSKLGQGSIFTFILPKFQKTTK